ERDRSRSHALTNPGLEQVSAQPLQALFFAPRDAAHLMRCGLSQLSADGSLPRSLRAAEQLVLAKLSRGVQAQHPKQPLDSRSRSVSEHPEPPQRKALAPLT